MKERPILFNTAMVQAILACRKTQSRRALKYQPQRSDFLPNLCFPKNAAQAKALYPAGWIYPNALDEILTMCPFGEVGDRLWVRETWSVVSHSFSDDGQLIDWDPDRPAIKVHEMPFGNGYYSGHAIYAADGYFQWGDEDGDETDRSHWKPSIHMPRAACRIILEITSVRVERLQEISEADACAEGCDNSKSDAAIAAGWYEKPIAAFRRVWGQTGGQWNANPWVWVIEFKVLTTNGVVPEVGENG